MARAAATTQWRQGEPTVYMHVRSLRKMRGGPEYTHLSPVHAGLNSLLDG